MKHASVATLACLLLAGACLAILARAEEGEKVAEKPIVLKPVGAVKTEDKRAFLVLNKDLQPALLGLDGFSHVWVFWWFSGSDTPQKRAVLQVHPRGNRANPLTGVFACRAPVRPNLVALTLCRIVAVRDNVVEVEKIDAFDGTPILDLKPYIPGIDSANATIPEWLRKGRGPPNPPAAE